MANVFSIDIYVTFWYINIVGNFLFFLSHGVHLFMYYFLNSAFRINNQYYRIKILISKHENVLKRLNKTKINNLVRQYFIITT